MFRRNGDQCKAPAEKGSAICHGHAAQHAMTLRRERERAAVLAKAVAEMRRQGKAECETPELFTDFKGIQVTMAVMAQALIDGRIDCKTAGRLVVHLQTMSKLLWMVHRKSKSTTEARRHREEQGLPQMCADERRLDLSPPINTDWKKLSVEKNWAVTFSARRPTMLVPAGGGAKILQFEVTAFGDGSRAHGPPESKAA